MSLNSVQQSWMSSMKNWLSQISAVNPDYAKSAASALAPQAKALGIDANDISDLTGGADSGDIQDTPASFGSTTQKAAIPSPSVSKTEVSPPTNSTPAASTSGASDSKTSDSKVSGNFNTAAPSNDGPMSAEDRATFAKNLAAHLKDKYGLNDAQVSGVIGNLTLESRMNPHEREGMGSYGGPADPVKGMGIAQWTGIPGRGGDFADFCKQNGYDMNSEAGNVAFLDHELDGQFSGVISSLKATSTPQDAALAWEKDFEKAATPNADSRVSIANNFYDFLKGNDSAYMGDLNA